MREHCAWCAKLLGEPVPQSMIVGREILPSGVTLVTGILLTEAA